MKNVALEIALRTVGIVSVTVAVWWWWAAYYRAEFVRRGFDWQNRHPSQGRVGMAHPFAFECLRWIAGFGFAVAAWLVLYGLFSWVPVDAAPVFGIFVAIFVGGVAVLSLEAAAGHRDG